MTTITKTCLQKFKNISEINNISYFATRLFFRDFTTNFNDTKCFKYIKYDFSGKLPDLGGLWQRPLQKALLEQRKQQL